MLSYRVSMHQELLPLEAHCANGSPTSLKIIPMCYHRLSFLTKHGFFCPDMSIPRITEFGRRQTLASLKKRIAPAELGVWCAILPLYFIKPLFFDESINAEQYQELMI